MGIRVDEDALIRQLALAGCPERAELPFQKAILDKELPYTIGGGIGQSRICMFYLRKAHIGEVQASLWPDDVCREAAAPALNFCKLSNKTIKKCRRHFFYGSAAIRRHVRFTDV